MKILAVCGGCKTQYDLTGWQTGDSVRCRCGTLVVVPEPRAQEARLVRCASCGAVRNAEGAPNCGYCGALFSAIDKGWDSMCPGCFCRLPNDARFCVECGLRIEPHALAAAATALRCPRCTTSLSLRTLEKIQMNECGACAGLWLSADRFEELCRDRDTQAVATSNLGLGKARTKFEIDPKEQVKYIPCPACSSLMNRHNFGGSSGVIIDTCKCGVWLDNQELNRIVRFINDGGLERAREREQHERSRTSKPKAAAFPHVASGVSGMGGPLQSSSGGGAPVLVQVLIEVVRAFLR